MLWAALTFLVGSAGAVEVSVHEPFEVSTSGHVEVLDVSVVRECSSGDFVLQREVVALSLSDPRGEVRADPVEVLLDFQPCALVPSGVTTARLLVNATPDARLGMRALSITLSTPSWSQAVGLPIVVRDGGTRETGDLGGSPQRPEGGGWLVVGPRVKDWGLLVLTYGFHMGAALGPRRGLSWRSSAVVVPSVVLQPIQSQDPMHSG